MTSSDIRTMTLRQNAFSPQVAARIAGAAYLIMNTTAEFNLSFVLPGLFVVSEGEQDPKAITTAGRRRQ